jgi:hypothetical protein
MLDIVEKLLRIVFTVLLGAVVSVIGLKVQWDKIGIETDAICFNQYDTIAPLLAAQEVLSRALVERYARRCQVTLEQAGAELNEAKAAIEITATAVSAEQGGWIATAAPEPGGIDTEPRLSGHGTGDGESLGDLPKVGFVALGRALTDVYAQVNFDRLDGSPATGDGTAPAQGEKLRARWEVNLRQNTNATTGGQNPVTGLIATGQCVEVLGPPEERRTQFWALVKPVAC